MNLFEISSLVIPILTAPIWLSILGWLNSRIRHQRRLTQYSQILANLPKGYERDRWQVIVDDQSKDARLAMKIRTDSGDIFPIIVFGLSVLTALGMMFSEGFESIVQDFHPLFRYIFLAVFVVTGLFSIRSWNGNRKAKQKEAEQHEKMIKEMYQSDHKR